jgi:hypothetical protein
VAGPRESRQSPLHIQASNVLLTFLLTLCHQVGGEEAVLTDAGALAPLLPALTEAGDENGVDAENAQTESRRSRFARHFRNPNYRGPKGDEPEEKPDDGKTRPVEDGKEEVKEDKHAGDDETESGKEKASDEPEDGGGEFDGESEDDAFGEDEPEKQSFLDKVRDTLNISGYFRSRYFRDFEKHNGREQTDEWRNDLRVQSSIDLVDSVRLELSGDARVHPVRNEDDGVTLEISDLDLWEANIQMSFGPVDLLFGQHAIRWGKSDELNPTDNFTPEDFRELINLDRAERKIPVPMAQMKIYWPEFTYEAIWQPYFTPNEGAAKESDWYFPAIRIFEENGFVLDVNEPPKTIRSNVFAHRLQYRGPIIDLGISYAYHYNQTPALHIVPPKFVPGQFPPIPLGPPRLRLDYHRVNSIGFEFETVIGGLGLRGEAVYTKGEPLQLSPFGRFDRDKVRRKDTSTFVIGADYTFDHDVYLNLQYSGKNIFHQTADLLVQKYEHQVVWNVSRKFMRDRLELSFSGRYAFNPEGFFITPEIWYRVNNYMTCRLWVNVFGGDDTALFGTYNGNDQVGLEVKIRF